MSAPVHARLTRLVYVAQAFRSAAPRAARAIVMSLAVLATLAGIAQPARAQETIEYYGTDHVGSVRVVFDANGTVISRADYLPYGEEVFAPTGQMPAQQFTGQARDGEAGQDYFHARMYQPRTGRFNAVDPVFNALANPQKWNRYSYAINRPTSLTDTHGLDPTNHPDYDWIMGGLLNGPTVGRAFGDRGGGGGGFRSEFSLAAERAHEDRLEADFWEGIIDNYVPTGKLYETDVALVTDINPIMQLAHSITGWEWAKNIFIEPGTGSFRAGTAYSSQSAHHIDPMDAIYNATDQRRGSVWGGLFHTHPSGFPRLSRPGDAWGGGQGDIEFANSLGVAIYSGASTEIWAYYPPAWTGGSPREVRISR